MIEPSAEAIAVADLPRHQPPESVPQPLPPQAASPYRRKLRALCELIGHCAADERELEQAHLTALARHEEAVRGQLHELTAHIDQQRQLVQQEHAHRLADIQAALDRQTRDMAQAAAEERHEHQSQHQSLERTAQQEYEQEKWLADSVLEVNQERIRTEATAARKELADKLQSLEEIVTQAATLMDRYSAAAHAPTHHASTTSDDSSPGLTFASRYESAQANLSTLRHMKSPKLFVGGNPWLIGALLCLAAAAVAQWWSSAYAGNVPTSAPAWKPIVYAVIASLVVVLLVGAIIRRMAVSRLHEVHSLLLQNAAEARRASRRQADDIDETARRHTDSAEQNHQREVQRVKDKHAPSIARSRQTHGSAVAEIDSRQLHQLEILRTQAAQDQQNAENELQDRLKTISDKQITRQEMIGAQDKAERERLDAQYALSRQTIARELEEASAQSATFQQDGDGVTRVDWSHPSWRKWAPPTAFASAIRFGSLFIDPRQIAESAGGALSDNTTHPLPLPPAFNAPALLNFPDEASLFIRHGPDQRPAALRTLQLIMTRLLTGLPPGRARFTLIDPVGLGQNFAGFMHLADYEESLVGGRIWTESSQIEQRLADLTEHMETVIQKYLRNEYPTIDQYNQQAGELAEPYRFLVIADFPTGFSDESLRRLAAIAASGPRCGVHVLIACDQRQTLSQNLIHDLTARSIFLTGHDGSGDTHAHAGCFVWKQDVFEQLPLTLDPPPDEPTLTRLMEQVGRAAKRARRVEVPFDAITPPPGQLWTHDATDGIHVPIGRSGATRLQALRLGQGMAQHALVAGKTGSGKSTLLHVLITNLALWYSPDEVELYLIDFKRGVEFKTYCTHTLQHARAVAIESDREFALSILQRLDGELARRGQLFRKAGVQDLPAYRACGVTPKIQLPRTLLIIDEFQEFFSEDDRLAQEAALLLDRLVRQGRAFGIHVLLGSQTISGASALSRSTLGQMAVRIALQTSEADSQLILGDNNSAARLLDRPGEAIYNDAGGLIEANSPFQVAWLDDAQRERQLARVQAMTAAHPHEHAPLIVFEGNIPADIAHNGALTELIHHKPDAAPSVAQAYVGDPVAIRPPTAIPLRRLSGANLLIVGQNDRSALAMLNAAVISLAARHPTADAAFDIFDATVADSPLAGWFANLAAIIPHPLRIIPWRDTSSAINDLAGELAKRRSDDSIHHRSTYIIINGLQRYRLLRKSDDAFSFSADEEQKPADPARQFADLLRDGPPAGMHVLCWCDTPASLERTLDRNALREFDHRVLMQMSATDSSNLMDSPAANKLGMHRALSYSEEMGTIEKFRPYDLPPPQWMQQVSQALRDRS